MTEAMDAKEGLAPATVHRRLKRLRDKGLITLVTDASDQRVRYIEPTPQALRYFAELDAMRNAIRAWAAVRGHEVVDRPFEVYTGGVGPAFTENGKFDLYWQVKN